MEKNMPRTSLTERLADWAIALSIYRSHDQRCKTRIAILPIILKKIVQGNETKFQYLGKAWLKKVTIIQTKIDNRWETIAVLPPDDALIYLLEQ
jgi:hypothetical protein